MTVSIEWLRAHGFEVRDGEAVRVRPEEPDAPIAEEDVAWGEMQKRVYRVFRKADCEVWWLSEARRVRITAGLPDLLIFGPPGHPFMAFWETKAGRGKLSDAQRKFALHCQRTRTPFGSGGENVARAFLKRLLRDTEVTLR